MCSRRVCVALFVINGLRLLKAMFGVQVTFVFLSHTVTPLVKFCVLQAKGINESQYSYTRRVCEVYVKLTIQHQAIAW